MKFGQTALYCVLSSSFITVSNGFGNVSPITALTGTPTSAAVAAAMKSNLNMVAQSQDTETSIDSATPRKRTKQERLEAASKGLQVHVVGLSIHHASVEVREKLAIAENDWNAASNDICATGEVAEAAVLSTCNRFEVYYAAADPREAMACVTNYLAGRSGLPVSVLRQNLFMLSGDDAVWHIMRVSGGLDSLIVGEGQILSQVRQCHLHSIEEDGCGGKVLSRMLNNAVAAGKRVRSETAIAKGSVSISSAAVELSEMLAQDDLNLPFSECRLAVVGAGKMTRLLVTHLASRGLQKIAIVNRSDTRPKELQEQFPDIDIEIKLMDDLWDVVGRSDIVYTATSSVDYVITDDLLKENGLAGGRPLMLVDISVPRNIAEACNTVPNVKAYNVDDLKAVVAKNTAMRQREMIEAETLLREETDAFIRWRDSLSAIPTINLLQEKANSVRMEELDKCTRKLKANNNLSDKEMEAVERLSRGIVNKLLHGPMAHLRQTEGGDQKKKIDDLSSIFDLNEKNGRGRRR
mmetsp:Transcript_4958/g.7256  ORF Transcript_4958/g.7256 Transcript_4958/m.7256 type:complete len:522 (-) Transcript_4958:90-1655(-)